MKFLLSILVLTSIFCPLFTGQDEMKAELVEKPRTPITSDSQDQISNDSSEIPPDGKYHYDVAFAEWGGKSMGVQVAVIIKGVSVKVIYEGVGKLTAQKGEILTEGILRKHKSGQWIITKSESDTEIDEIGGCTGGPSVIDFDRKKFWLC